MSTSFDNWERQYLEHHGIPDMHWGVRRYQNKDGTLTALGRLRASRYARKENRLLKKDIKADKKIVKEWKKEKKEATKKAIKNDNYRKDVADMEARRLKMNPKEMRELLDAHLAGERVADNIMWYKHGSKPGDLLKSRRQHEENISKSILNKVQQKANYKALKVAGKKSDYSDVLKSMPKDKLSKIAKAMQKEETQYLSGKKYVDGEMTSSRKLMSKLVGEFVGDYGKKKVYGPDGRYTYAVNAVHKVVSNEASKKAFGDYDKFREQAIKSLKNRRKSG